jgi:hypothetical protein
MRYTINTLKKLEELFEEMEYVVRYEKGSFNSGYCLVENKKIAVLNKFYDTEARINCLIEILNTQNLDASALGEKSKEFFDKIKKN